MKATRVSASHVVMLLKSAKVHTLRWDYQKASWSIGPEVEVEHVNGIAYLRTNPNTTLQDNLNNLPQLTTCM